VATRRATSRQRAVWSSSVTSWDTHGSPALANVTAAVLGVAKVQPGDVVIDLGAGTGQLSLPLARQGAEVLAVDVSPVMVNALGAKAASSGLRDLHGLAMPIEVLDLPAGTADLIISSYALHHLRDPDKERLVHAAFRWLRPGGQLLIADMMFGRGGSSRDRNIIRIKIIALARKGPGGWWRIIKNAGRYLMRVQECPISMSAWTELFERAGFTQVTASGIVAEAGLVTGQRPATAKPAAAGAHADRTRG
jgi:ubiquinone/menaquinone biosynthesis C-methylase UbiE